MPLERGVEKGLPITLALNFFDPITDESVTGTLRSMDLLEVEVHILSGRILSFSLPILE